MARQLPEVASLSNVYKKPVNLEFRDATVKMVFDALERTTGINFVFDRDVKLDQRTTVFLKQTRFEDAIDVLLTTNQLEKKVLNATSVLIYPNTQAKTKEYQELLVKAFYLSNIEAKTAANLLKSVLKLKDVYVDEKYHMLVLRENAETIALAEKLIALQDLEEPEVMLEVEVLEVSRNSLLNLGLQVSNQFTVSPLNGLNSGSVGNNNGSNSATYKLSDLLNLNKDKLGITLPSATLSLQKTDGDANLLANPRLRVRDRDKAKILIGDRVPVVTTTTTPNGFLSENIQYLDVGLKLDVEPEIHLRDEIGLKMSLEVSSLVGSVKTATGSQAYQIGTRTISSSLRLRDGETQVLAGLISDADRSDANRIPLLGDLPVVGRLFSSQKDDRQKTEIVMSITPRLIRNIQRKSPGEEMFWSGTESNLRTRPVQLGAFNSAAPNAGQPAAEKKAAAPQAAGPDPSGLALSWKAPQTVKVGQAFTVELHLDTRHQLRATPLQLAFNPAAYEVVAVESGDFFARNGQPQFSQMVDKAGGRVSVGLGAGDPKGASGTGTLVKVQLRPLSASVEGDVSLIGLTPVGSVQAISAPALPVPAHIVIE
jgi:general secretion pathway protein D